MFVYKDCGVFSQSDISGNLLNLIMKRILFLIFTFCSISFSNAQIPKNGTYTYKIAFAEWDKKTLGAKCKVVIEDDKIKIINVGGNVSVKKGDVIEEGKIMKHRKSGKWIIGHSEKDKDAEEVGGCSDGPIEIDFENKTVHLC